VNPQTETGFRTLTDWRSGGSGHPGVDRFGQPPRLLLPSGF